MHVDGPIFQSQLIEEKNLTDNFNSLGTGKKCLKKGKKMKIYFFCFYMFLHAFSRAFQKI